MQAAGREPKDSLENHLDDLLMSISAGLCRRNRQVVGPDPTLEEPAHGYVFGDKKKQTKRALRDAAEWIVPEASPPWEDIRLRKRGTRDQLQGPKTRGDLHSGSSALGRAHQIARTQAGDIMPETGGGKELRWRLEGTEARQAAASNSPLSASPKPAPATSNAGKSSTSPSSASASAITASAGSNMAKPWSAIFDRVSPSEIEPPDLLVRAANLSFECARPAFPVAADPEFATQA